MLRTFATLALSAAVLAPAAIADGRKPGTVLIYPVHRSGPDYFTVLCVTNTNTTPASPTTFGGSTNVHFEYYNVVPNPANPFVPLDCVVFDRVEFLTPADTLCVLTTCHNASAPGGQEGYVKVTAQSTIEHDTDWCFNFLIGSEMVINAYGAMYSVNAKPISTLPNCQPEPQAFKGLAIPAFIASADSSLALATNIPGNPYAIRHLLFSVWNDNEVPLSATLAFRCWFDQPLSTISPLFTDAFLRSVPNDPDELDINCDGVGDFETGWVRIDTTNVSLPGGAVGGPPAPLSPSVRLTPVGAYPTTNALRDMEILTGQLTMAGKTNMAIDLILTF
ncbi:MAG: hypothetical protein KDB80_10375 [Planctomycetes bacterium]|nr:hypothetical protein [Planctomycetota bacterium]